MPSADMQKKTLLMRLIGVFSSKGGPEIARNRISVNRGGGGGGGMTLNGQSPLKNTEVNCRRSLITHFQIV